MKRAHRRWHRRGWLVWAAVLLVLIVAALWARTAVPANADWPAALVGSTPPESR